VPEAAEWPNLRHYESLAWLERVPVPNDYSGEGAVEYPPAPTTSRLADVLQQPEQEPTPAVVAWSRKMGPVGQSGASIVAYGTGCPTTSWRPPPGCVTPAPSPRRSSRLGSIQPRLAWASGWRASTLPLWMTTVPSSGPQVREQQQRVQQE
jgi:hypothetical protein